MTLRTRILSGFGFVLLLFVVLSVGVVLVQRNQLIDQLDARLEATAPLQRDGPPDRVSPGDPAPREPPDGAEVERPTSDLYIADVFPDGRTDVRVQGQLLTALPDIAAIASTFPDKLKITTIGSVDGTITFRVLIEPRGQGEFVFLAALPMTDLDQSVRRLLLSVVAAALLIGAILALLAWWVVRLGIRPISTVAETARAISAGEREQRAPELDQRTEAGQLGTAFNVMLDDRDEAENRLRRFVSDASHELRTPLTSIRGYLDLYAEGGFRGPGQMDDAVRRMQSESARMATLVEDLLQLARLDEGQPLDVRWVDVCELLAGVVADARAARPERIVTFGGTTPERLSAAFDADKVKQLVTGLVDNALTHTEHASVTVYAEASLNELAIHVTDDGPGLSAEEADRVFDRFYRTDASRSRTSGGSGLGLSIAQAVAGRHGGRIELTTAPGTGCAFIVRLPREQRDTR